MLVILLLLLLHIIVAEVDAKSKANYTIIQVDDCPDEGYLFKKELPVNGTTGVCNLCFCETTDHVVCWRRESHRCDTEKYHIHGIGRRHARVGRSLGFADVFFRDAARDVLNKRQKQECIPYKDSKSEGCPPADWCLGCTVCDCDANGYWDCHILSFCDNEPKKQKPNGKRLDLLKYPLPLPTTPASTTKIKKTPKPWKPTPRPKPRSKTRKRSINKNSSPQKSNIDKKPANMTKVRKAKKVFKKHKPASRGKISVQKKTPSKSNNTKSSKAKTKKIVKRQVDLIPTNITETQALFKNKAFNDLVSRNNISAVKARQVLKNMMSVLKKVAIRNMTRIMLNNAICNLTGEHRLPPPTAVTPEFNMLNLLKNVNLRTKRQANQAYYKKEDAVTKYSTPTIGVSQITLFDTQSKSFSNGSVFDSYNNSEVTKSVNASQIKDYYKYSIEKANITKVIQVITNKSHANDVITVLQLKSDRLKNFTELEKVTRNDPFDKTTEKLNHNVDEKPFTVFVPNISVGINKTYSNLPQEVKKIVHNTKEEKLNGNESPTKKYFLNIGDSFEISRKKYDSKTNSNSTSNVKFKNKRRKHLRNNDLLYLRKFFTKILYLPRKNKSLYNRTAINTHRILKTLCNNYNLCSTNRKTYLDVQKKLVTMTKEGFHIMRTIKIISQLLKLLDLPFDRLNLTDRDKNENMSLQRSNINKKLIYILTDEYLKEKNNFNLTKTQLNTISYIKLNTQLFIESVNKCAKILNETISMLSQKKYSHNEKGQNNATAKGSKYYTKLPHIVTLASDIDENSHTSRNKIVEDPVSKVKHLLKTYNIIQNTFFKKIIESLDNLERTPKKLGSGVTKRGALNKSEQIDIFSKKIIGNLRKLKDLATKLSIKRSKRSLVDSDELDYMLMFMENLMKRQSQQTCPGNGGLDILIDAIKHAPEIKPTVLPTANRVLFKSKSLSKIDSPAKEKTNIGLFKSLEDESSNTELYNELDSEDSENDNKETTSEPSLRDIADIENTVNEINDGNLSLDKLDNVKKSEKSLGRLNKNVTTKNVFDKLVLKGNKLVTDLDTVERQENRLGLSSGSQKPCCHSHNVLKNNIGQSRVYGNGISNEYVGSGFNDVDKSRGRGGDDDDKRPEFYNSESEDDDSAVDHYTTTTETQANKIKSTTSKLETVAETTVTALINDRSENKNASKLNINNIVWFQESSEDIVAESTEKPIVKTTTKVNPSTRKQIKLTTLEPATEYVNIETNKRKRKKVSPSEILRKKQMEFLSSLDYETEKVSLDKSGEQEIKWAEVESDQDKLSSETRDNTGFDG